MKRSKRKYRRNYNMLAKKYAEGGQITGSLDQFARADKNVDTFQEKLLDIQKAMLGQETDTQFGANLASAVDAGRAVGNTFMNVSSLGLINPEEMGSSMLGNFQMAQMGGPINKYVNGTEVTTSDYYDPFDPNSLFGIGTPPTLPESPESYNKNDMAALLKVAGAIDPTLGAVLPQEKQPFDWKGMLSQLSQSGALNNLGQQSPMADMMGTLGQGVNKFKQAMDSGNTDRNIEAMAQKRDRVDDLKRMYGDKYNRETSRGADPRMQSYIQDLEGATTGDIFQKSPFQKMMELTKGAAETGNQLFNQAGIGLDDQIGNVLGIVGNIFGAENGGMVPGYKDGGTVADYRNEDKLAEMQMAMSEPTPNAPTSGMQMDPMTGGIMIPEDFEGTAKLKGPSHDEGGIPVFTPAEGQGVVETEMEGDEVVDVEGGETFVFPKGKHTKQKEKREAEAMKLKEMLNDPKVQKDMFKVATIERRLQTLETEEKAHREQIIQEKRAKEQTEAQERADMDRMLAEGKYISKNGTYRQGGKVKSLTDAQKARLSEVYADVPDSYQDGSEVENKELPTFVYGKQLEAIYDEAWGNIDNQFGYSKKEVDSGEAAQEFANELNRIFKRDKITGRALRDQNDPTKVLIKDPSGIVAPTGGDENLLYSFRLPVNAVGEIPGQLFNDKNLPILEKAKKDFVENIPRGRSRTFYEDGYGPGLRNLMSPIKADARFFTDDEGNQEDNWYKRLREAQYKARGWALDETFESPDLTQRMINRLGPVTAAPGTPERKAQYDERYLAYDDTIPGYTEPITAEEEERRASITPDPIDPVITTPTVDGGRSSSVPSTPKARPVSPITPEPKERPDQASTTTDTDFSKNIPQPNQGFRRRNYEITPGDRLGMSILQSAGKRMRDITEQNRLATDPNMNFYENIGQRAEDTLNAGLESIYAAKEQAGSRIGSDFKAALNTIRNASTSYGNMAARANSLYDSKENARLKSDLTYDQTAIGQKNKLAEMQKYTDTMRARGDEQRDLRDREDIDNYYTQLAQNEALAQQLGMQQAQAMNQSYLNQLLANVQSSMNQYGYDAQGNLVFKQPGGQQPKQQCPEGMKPCYNGNGCYDPNIQYNVDPCTQRNTPGGFGGDFNTFLQEMLRNRGGKIS